MLSRKHPEYFNSFGGGIWKGRIYATGAAGVILRPSVIYHGVFGSGFFQRLYAGEAALPVMLCTSLLFHVFVNLPLLVLTLYFNWLWPLALASVAFSLSVSALAAAQAHDFLAGVACANDVSARDLQKSDGQWGRAKGFDTFCPLGATVTSGFDWDNLEIIGRVNGEVRQHGHVRDLIFSIPVLLEFITGVMTLEPGDVILTGTPEGVGPLAPGDVVDIEIPGVSVLSNPVAGEEA